MTRMYTKLSGTCPCPWTRCSFAVTWINKFLPVQDQFHWLLEHDSPSSSRRVARTVNEDEILHNGLGKSNLVCVVHTWHIFRPCIGDRSWRITARWSHLDFEVWDTSWIADGTVTGKKKIFFFNLRFKYKILIQFSTEQLLSLIPSSYMVVPNRELANKPSFNSPTSFFFSSTNNLLAVNLSSNIGMDI